MLRTKFIVIILNLIIKNKKTMTEAFGIKASNVYTKFADIS